MADWFEITHDLARSCWFRFIYEDIFRFPTVFSWLKNQWVQKINFWHAKVLKGERKNCSSVANVSVHCWCSTDWWKQIVSLIISLLMIKLFFYLTHASTHQPTSARVTHVHALSVCLSVCLFLSLSLSLSLSLFLLSLSLSHTHTHTHSLSLSFSVGVSFVRTAWASPIDNKLCNIIRPS